MHFILGWFRCRFSLVFRHASPCSARHNTRYPYYDHRHCVIIDVCQEVNVLVCFRTRGTVFSLIIYLSTHRPAVVVVVSIARNGSLFVVPSCLRHLVPGINQNAFRGRRGGGIRPRNSNVCLNTRKHCTPAV